MSLPPIENEWSCRFYFSVVLPILYQDRVHWYDGRGSHGAVVELVGMGVVTPTKRKCEESGVNTQFVWRNEK